MSPFLRALTAGSVALVAAVALSGCVPEPTADASPSAVDSPSATAGSAAPEQTPTPTSTPTVALPASCDDIYSDALRARLDQQTPPLNDPGVTLLSTEQAPLLELLEAVPSLRCSWGVPSETGLATTVAVVDDAQAATVRETLAAAGFECDESEGATVCRIAQRGVTLDDVPFERGEVQALRGGLWVSTSWINLDVDGYTEDILSTLSE